MISIGLLYPDTDLTLVANGYDTPRRLLEGFTCLGGAALWLVEAESV